MTNADVFFIFSIHCFLASRSLQDTHLYPDSYWSSADLASRSLQDTHLYPDSYWSSADDPDNQNILLTTSQNANTVHSKMALSKTNI